VERKAEGKGKGGNFPDHVYIDLHVRNPKKKGEVLNYNHNYKQIRKGRREKKEKEGTRDGIATPPYKWVKEKEKGKDRKCPPLNKV